MVNIVNVVKMGFNFILRERGIPVVYMFFLSRKDFEIWFTMFTTFTPWIILLRVKHIQKWLFEYLQQIPVLIGQFFFRPYPNVPTIGNQVKPLTSQLSNNLGDIH